MIARQNGWGPNRVQTNTADCDASRKTKLDIVAGSPIPILVTGPVVQFSVA
jgi:hypothetical protein